MQGSYDRACCCGYVEGISKSLQVLFNGIEAVMVVTLVILE